MFFQRLDLAADSAFVKHNSPAALVKLSCRATALKVWKRSKDEKFYFFKGCSPFF